jgi:hypothetical protein
VPNGGTVFVSLFSQYYLCCNLSYSFSGSGISSGIILQRFPEKDWSDTPFIEGIEWVITLKIRNYHLQFIY